MKKCFLIVLFIFPLIISAQNKSGNSFIFGEGGIYAQFAGDTSKPTFGQLYSSGQPYYPHDFLWGSSSICDSATGQLKVACNGFILFDSLGNIVENGDSLVPSKIYLYNGTNLLASTIPQTSLVLPKGSNGQYYVFISTITDTTWDKFINSPIKFPYDLLQYNVLDANANGGLGKVMQKNVPVISNAEISRVGMMACRHANGYDWWLLKQAGIDSMSIYKILVTADSVIVKDNQSFPAIGFGKWDLAGQSCFSTNGKKYAFSCGRSNQLFLADFDRCSGDLRNEKIIRIPIDSTTHPGEIASGRWDSLVNGVCFSPNDSFIYITRNYNIYQYEVNNPDSATAWYRVKHGEDTSLLWFNYYGQLARGVDGRIYIGKLSNAENSNSVIDKPNLKGAACDFCRKCLRYNVPNTHTLSPSSMPNFLLGADSSGCWPLSNGELIIENGKLVVYPNPTNSKLRIKNGELKMKELYNSVGQLIFSTKENEINVSGLSKGMYYLRVENQVVKVIVE